MDFKLYAKFKPAGSQPQAIEALVSGIEAGKKHQVLLGVTGSGKTFTAAGVIARLNRPTLVLAHNKTLAAQLCSEFKEFFPENAVEFFVSYYDYYQPEAYIPRSDTYIEKDAQINDEINRLRLSATSSLLSRRDVVIVASVSCIYGLGDPEEYNNVALAIEKGQIRDRDALLRRLVASFYERNDAVLSPGRFRVRGDTVEVMPAYRTTAYRISFWGDEVERISEVDTVTGRATATRQHLAVFPATHYAVERENMLAQLDAYT